jgi:hypothetical protein
MSSACQTVTDERKNCGSELDYTIEGKEGVLNCTEYCFQDCKNISSNIMSRVPEKVKFRKNDGTLIPNDGIAISEAAFILNFEDYEKVIYEKDEFGWRIHLSNDLDNNLKYLAQEGSPLVGFFLSIDPREGPLSNIFATKSFCRILSTIPMGKSISLDVIITTEPIPSILNNEITALSINDKIDPIFPSYPSGKYIYKSGGWGMRNRSVGNGKTKILLTSEITFTKNSEITDTYSMPSDLFPSYDDLINKRSKKDLSHYISSAAKARVLDDVKYCSNPKEFFSQDELDEISRENIITFILQSEKKKPLVICLDKSSLFEYWKSKDSGQGWLFGQCLSENIHHCRKFYKIPGDITLLIGEEAKNAVIKLWKSKNRYTMFNLIPLKKAKIGRGLHYIGEAGGEQMIYDITPVAITE